MRSVGEADPDDGHLRDPDAITALVEDDMAAVTQVISERLSSDIVLINQLATYIVQSGGKRLRPLTLVLSARALDYQGDAHVLLAAVVEFIHTATLLHDDVVDDSDLRRGQPTAKTVWGNSASVLVGDFLYSRAFEMMVESRSMRVMEIMARTTNVIAEGEVMQLLNVRSPDLTEPQYRETIKRKTARLFESAAQLGAVLAGSDESTERALAEYGLRLGMAFQLVDDMLDYTADSDDMGKNRGDDLAEGKATLPVIHAINHAPDAERRMIRTAIETGNRDAIDEVTAVINQCQSLEYTANAARTESQNAIDALSSMPDSDYKKALQNIARFAVERTY